MSRKSRTTPTGLAARGFLAFGGGLLALGLVVLVVTAAVTAWPRVASGLLTADLRYSVVHAGVPVRDLQSTITGITLPNATDFDFTTQTISPTWKGMPKALVAARHSMPQVLRSATAPGRFVGQAVGPPVANAGPSGVHGSGTSTAPGASGFVFPIEANNQLRSDAVLVSGRWPKRTINIPSTRPVEVVLSAASAKAIGWRLGQTQTFNLDSATDQKVVLVGTLRPRDPSTDYWQLDLARSRPGVTVSPDLSFTTYRSVAYVNPSTWTTIALEIGRPTIQSWFPVQGSGLQVASLDSLESGLQHYLASPTRVTNDQPAQLLRFTTLLPGTLDDFVASAGPVNTLLTLFATGPLGTAIAVLFLGVRLLLVRRSSGLALMWARGASTPRLGLRVALETAVVSVPAALIGGVLAVALTSGAQDAATGGLVLACGLAPPAVVAVAVRSVLHDPGRGTRPRPTWILEVLAVALAALSVVVLLQRGISSSGDPFAPDPLLVLTPLLVAFGVCVIVLRVYPLALRAIGLLLRRGTRATGFLGWATSIRSRSGTLWPVFAVVTGVSITIFSLSVLTTERAGVQNAAQIAVGADVSVTAASLSTDQLGRIRATPGVGAVTTVEFAGDYAIRNSAEDVLVYLVDPAGISAALASVPVSQRPLAALPTGSRATGLAGGLSEKKARSIELTASRGSIPVNVSPVSRTPSGFIANGSWLVLDRSTAPTALRAAAHTVTALVSLKPGADANAVSRAIGRVGGAGAVVDSAPAQVAAIRARPLLGGIEGLTLAALLLSALMCAAALVLTLVMNAGPRIRLVGTLRTLGFSRRQTMLLTGWELGPVVIAGIIAGTLVGLLLPLLLLASVNLASLTGSSVRPPLVVLPLALLASIVAFALAAVVATLIAIGLARRVPLATVLRTGRE